MNNVRKVGPAQINHEQQAEQQAAQLCALSGENPGNNQNQQACGQPQKQNEPASLAEAERGNFPGHAFVTESHGLQITNEPWFF